MPRNHSTRHLLPAAALIALILSSTFTAPALTESENIIYPAGILAGRSQSGEPVAYLPLRRTDIQLHLIATSRYRSGFRSTARLRTCSGVWELGRSLAPRRG